MKVRVPMMVQDPNIAPHGQERIVEGFDITQEKFFLDGPVTGRVALLDFDPNTETLLPGVPFLPPPPNRVLGHYQIADENDIYASDFIRVSVFATVLKTMYMFEEDDALGRRMSWAFDGPQLLVVPRAGEWENAFYERDSRSLQFFYFPNPQRPDEMIYTSLSRDIVAHETGHAILDGIAPHLYNAITPQSLALHEAIADLTALLLSIRSNNLRRIVLDATQGSIRDATHFSSIAEQFGMARGAGALRDLYNDKTLNQVDQSEPHYLSEVLTGALYKMLVNMHEDRKQRYAAQSGDSPFSVSGKALWDSGQQFKRMILRALDYLPPGEVSFADYARAIIAADQASHPDDPQERDWIRDEFVRRDIVSNREALEVPVPDVTLEDVDVDTLITSDWAAYDFANEYRELLGIPENIPFQVEPRLYTTKVYYHRDNQGSYREEIVQEYLFKVWWNQQEDNNLGRSYPGRRQITVGSTLAIDYETSRVRLLLTSDKSHRPDEQRGQQAARDRMLQRLAEAGLLLPGELSIGPDNRPLRSALTLESSGDLMRVSGAARMLHIIGEV
jgi:hypothetical protein